MESGIVFAVMTYEERGRFVADRLMTTVKRATHTTLGVQTLLVMEQRKLLFT